MFRLSTRSVIKVTGVDAAHFLHNVTTNDVLALSAPSAIYNCILNSRGRFLYDFFLIKLDECFLIDCLCTEREALVAFLRLYRVQLKVKVLKADQYVVAVDTAARKKTDAPTYAEISSEGVVSFSDVRCQDLGVRYIIPATSSAFEKISGEQDYREYEEIRIRNTVPAPTDMVKEESFPLHYGLDRLHAICHKKGCYIGQETVARMHIIGAKKRLCTLYASEAPNLPPAGTEVLAEGITVGKLLSTAGPYGLALLDTSKIQGQLASLLRVGELPVIVTSSAAATS